MRRRGFVMVWALFTMALAALLGSALFFCLHFLVSGERQAEMESDETLIAQDAMEREKYNARSGASLPRLTGTVERNGRTYEVRLTRRLRDIGGLPMQELTCTVTHASGQQVAVSTLVEDAVESGSGR